MKITNKQLTLAVDMYGCPNRCRHCWLGHFPNRTMENGRDRWIVDYFRPFFDSITFYSWLREPDFCHDYADRWQQDNELSIGQKPQRFELASFYRLVRDNRYVHFLQELQVSAVQLTFFGTQAMTDRYIGRKGAFRELLQATEILLNHQIAPRWQAFINSENASDIVHLLELSEAMTLKEKCRAFGREFVFFVHSGSCDGENEGLYELRINKEDIPRRLIPFYPNYNLEQTEAALYEQLKKSPSHFVYHNEKEIVLNISNTFDVYFNFTHMRPEWKIGNLLTDPPGELIRRIVNEDIPALDAARHITLAELVRLYGDRQSHKIFHCDDYKAYLLNRYLSDRTIR